MHKIVYTCDGKRRARQVQEASVAPEAGGREGRAGSVESGSGLTRQEPELRCFCPPGSAGTEVLQLLRQRARRRNSLASPFLLSSSLLPGLSTDTSEHSGKTKQRKRGGSGEWGI